MIPGCEALGLGGLFGLAFVTASLLWHLHTRPEAVLIWFRRSGEAATIDPVTLRALRTAVAALLVVLAAAGGALVVVWTSRT